MQNRGTSFSLDPKALNVLAPGRLPFHTLNPAPWCCIPTVILRAATIRAPMRRCGAVTPSARGLWQGAAVAVHLG
jgi:hypothetical protein